MTDFEVVQKLIPMLLDGLKLTVLIAILGIAFGFIIGCLAGYALQSKNKVAKGVAFVYIWIIRGTPLIVQALYIYYVLFSFLESTVAGVIVISINSGAFIAEIVRGALEGVDYGQTETGLSLGMKKSQILIHLVIPPAFRQILPALFNQFIIALKDTSLLQILAVNEMTQKAYNYAATSLRAIPIYTTLALFYLVLISLLMICQKAVENKLDLERAPKRKLREMFGKLKKQA
jgi:glutamine transport system permease protein